MNIKCNLLSSYYHKYSITKDGKVYSKYGNEELTYYVRDGFTKVLFSKGTENRETEWFRVDFLVASTFLDNPNNYSFIKHKDGNKLNNRLDNLEWREFCIEEPCKVIDGYNNKYIITSSGEVYNNFTGLKMKLRIIQGYYAVGLRKFDGKKSILRLFKVHRLVAEYFIPNLENKPIVNHKDGNKLNNNVTNLEWSTISENIRHAYRTGLAKTLWNKEKAAIVVNLIENYGYNYSDLANLFKVHKNSIAHLYQNGYKTFGIKVNNVFVPKYSYKKELPKYYKEYINRILKDNTVLS